jgi:RNA polymerase sporulation-specific sigma factor
MERSVDQLLAEARNGNTRALDELMRRFDYLAKAAIRGLFLPGASPEDLLQEARIGMLRALRSFDSTKGHLPGFLHMVARRKALQAIKIAQGSGKDLLTNAVTVVESDGDQVSLVEITPSVFARDPFYVVAESMELRSIIDAMPELSDTERTAILDFVSGNKLPERNTPAYKSYDNASQRALRKLRKLTLREAA